MIEGISPIAQSLLGSLFTWFLTALGAGLVFVLPGEQKTILDSSLGFAAGVMLAASYWSLLAPALDLASESGDYGDKGQYSFLPVSVGFLLGAAFVYSADVVLPHMNLISPSQTSSKLKADSDTSHTNGHSNGHISQGSVGVNMANYQAGGTLPCRGYNGVRSRGGGVSSTNSDDVVMTEKKMMTSNNDDVVMSRETWHRILLLIIAVTVHNIPEGLAVGVGFAAIGKTSTATFQNARNLALGIGIQNFPEGLAVSLPLMGAGYSKFTSFWYGQLSGMVEPLAALAGAAAVTLAEPLLPYALAFAAGAMVYVVIDDIIPETCMGRRSSNLVSTWSAMVGFLVMMTLDTTLG